MVIWGGGSTPDGTGGRYLPSANTWSTSSTVGAPSARSEQSGVFTNAEFILFGGIDATGAALADGGRYCACPQVNTFFADVDGDTFGTASTSMQTCDATPPTGFVANSTDCNDANPAIRPGVQEVCDGIDNNCSGVIDETFDTDFDQLGFCVDNSPNVFNPDQRDYDGDGIGDISDTAAVTADLDRSGFVDGVDLGRLAMLFGLADSDPAFDRRLDFDVDGRIDGDDLSIMASHFGEATGTILKPPATFTAALTAPTQSTLTWTTSPSPEVQGYRVDRVDVDLANPPPLQNRKWVSIAFLGASATTYVDSGLVPGHRYRYRVAPFAPSMLAIAAPVDFLRTLPGP